VNVFLKPHKRVRHTILANVGEPKCKQRKWFFLSCAACKIFRFGELWPLISESHIDLMQRIQTSKLHGWQCWWKQYF